MHAFFRSFAAKMLQKAKNTLSEKRVPRGYRMIAIKPPEPSLIIRPSVSCNL
jgi:hypothetical protein